MLMFASVAIGASKPDYAGPGFTPVARKAANANATIGINLAGLADWNTELPFADEFRLARKWISQQQGKPWGQGPALALDPHGWVTQLADGCAAETPMLTFPGHKPQGEYVLLYDGEGEFRINGGKVVASQPGRIVVAIERDSGGVFLAIRKTNPRNPVRNIRFLLPGCEATYKAQPFRQGFLDLWRGMNTYRFMDWMHTNGSEVAEWADRPKMSDATWTIRGVPLEVMIDLCNRQLINPWFCMPHKATDDYVRQFATQVRDTLDPTLHVYVEYSKRFGTTSSPRPSMPRSVRRSRASAPPSVPGRAAESGSPSVPSKSSRYGRRSSAAVTAWCASSPGRAAMPGGSRTSCSPGRTP
ncbi:MAG: hypothetical protein FJ290_04680 [Planctomycetes bacterium]|nr:hypothetical protein [Planctomycetota bacterium]